MGVVGAGMMHDLNILDWTVVGLSILYTVVFLTFLVSGIIFLGTAGKRKWSVYSALGLIIVVTLSSHNTKSAEELSYWTRLPGTAEQYLQDSGCPDIVWKNQQGEIVQVEFIHHVAMDVYENTFIVVDVPPDQANWAEQYMFRKTGWKKDYAGYPLHRRLHMRELPPTIKTGNCGAEVRYQ